MTAGFSWDEGLSALKPPSAAQEAESSDAEDHDRSEKVKLENGRAVKFGELCGCASPLVVFVGQTQKKSRHELEQEKKAAERALVQREAELMDPNLRPQDASAFERLILASPNSSLLWLQYMAHHLQATQIEQARSVAERALKTISFRYAHADSSGL